MSLFTAAMSTTCCCTAVCCAKSIRECKQRPSHHDAATAAVVLLHLDTVFFQGNPAVFCILSPSPCRLHYFERLHDTNYCPSFRYSVASCESLVFVYKLPCIDDSIAHISGKRDVSRRLTKAQQCCCRRGGGRRRRDMFVCSSIILHTYIFK